MENATRLTRETKSCNVNKGGGASSELKSRSTVTVGHTGLSKKYLINATKSTSDIFWAPPEHLVKYIEEAVPDDAYQKNMRLWYISHALSVHIRAGEEILSESKGGIGRLLVNTRTNRAKLDDGRRRLMIALENGLSFFPFRIQSCVDTITMNMKAVTVEGGRIWQTPS